MAAELGMKLIPAHREMGLETLIKTILGVARDKPCFLTFDIDLIPLCARNRHRRWELYFPEALDLVRKIKDLNLWI